MAHNVLGIKEGGMVNGAMSRKVEITLNSAVSLVQTLQPLLFIPCYKSGCGELRGVTRRSRNAFELQLAYNVEVFVSGGHKYTLKLTASCPPACTNTVLAAVYYE